MFNRNADYNQFAGKSIQRTEALADGVFAIAMTLLVLELAVPIDTAIHTEGELWQLLVSLFPKFISYFLSFMTLGIFWTAHSTQYAFIFKSDRHLSWLSLFFLLAVTLVPFTTAFLSDYITFRLAVGVYWLNLLLLGALLYFHWRYAYRNDFLAPELPDKATLNEATIERIVNFQILYFLAALLCFVNTYLSIGIIIVVQLYSVVAPRFHPTTNFEP